MVKTIPGVEYIALLNAVTTIILFLNKYNITVVVTNTKNEINVAKILELKVTLKTRTQSVVIYVELIQLAKTPNGIRNVMVTIDKTMNVYNHLNFSILIG